MALYLGIKRVSPNMITPLSGVTPSGIKNITDTSLIDVSRYQYAQVSDGNLVAGNIKKGVSILGVTGTLESGSGGSPSKLVNLISGDNISLTADDLAGLTKIDDYAFYNCGSLKSITIPDTVTSIGWYAFNGCSGLTSITIPDSVTIIDSDAFYRCMGLKRVTIGNSVTKILRESFAYCNNLTSITIPNSVTNIGESAFSNCTSLTSIKLGTGVIDIDTKAFRNCWFYLRSIECHMKTPPTLGQYVFDDDLATKDGFVITVPAGSIFKYLDATGWSQFADKIVESTEF